MTDILRLLFDMRDGEVAQDIARHFDELKKAVLETRGKGKLTIELALEPSKCAIGGAVLEIKTEHTCKVKKPELMVGVVMRKNVEPPLASRSTLVAFALP